LSATTALVALGNAVQEPPGGISTTNGELMICGGGAWDCMREKIEQRNHLFALATRLTVESKSQRGG